MNDVPANTKRPILTAEQKCSECGEEAEIGFGLAGGGYGVYAYCPKCEVILEKWQEPEESNDE